MTQVGHNKCHCIITYSYTSSLLTSFDSTFLLIQDRNGGTMGKSDKYNGYELGIEYHPVGHNLGVHLGTTDDIKVWDRGRSEKSKKGGSWWWRWQRREE